MLIIFIWYNLCSSVIFSVLTVEVGREGVLEEGLPLSRDAWELDPLLTTTGAADPTGWHSGLDGRAPRLGATS